MGKDIIDIHWDMWRSQARLIRELSFEHYILTLEAQIEEISQHYRDKNEEGVLKELADVISVTLNFFRWFGLSNEAIREVMLNRWETRYKGKTREIILKYEGKREKP